MCRRLEHVRIGCLYIDNFFLFIVHLELLITTQHFSLTAVIFISNRHIAENKLMSEFNMQA